MEAKGWKGDGISGPVFVGHGSVRGEVWAFAQLMEKRLRENDHKPGWKGDSPLSLLERASEELDELTGVLAAGRRDAVALGDEAADVANFAMMIADVGGSLGRYESTVHPKPAAGEPGVLLEARPERSLALLWFVSFCGTCAALAAFRIADHFLGATP